MGRFGTFLALLASACACGRTLAFTTGGGRSPASPASLPARADDADAKLGGRTTRRPGLVPLAFGPGGEEGGPAPADGKKKETTLDRIFGPKLFKTVTSWNGIHSVPLVPLRIMTGLLMVHHGSEGGIGPANFGSPEFQGFVDFIMKPYFGFLPGSLEGWAALHDYVEFFGGGLFAIGLLTRPSSAALLATMISAVYFHLSADGLQGFPLGHVQNYSYNFEEPLLYALIFLVFWFNGPGPLAVDNLIYNAISTEEEEE
mmetsp:Transcript_22356/g.50746  ORF Transcript_22356/g.50746 Transcript_22356/m.50746 type:complete len:258 (+) Transcript_22356:83-856(+)